MDDDRTHQALRELAAMYLTPGSSQHDRQRDDPPIDASPDQAPPQAAPRKGSAELALVGHLPGMANLWLNQYAQRLGQQQARPTILWRIEAQAVEVDVLNAGDNGQTFAPIHADSLAELVKAINRRSVCALIYPLDPPPSIALAAAQLSRWTVLSGADEAAIVAAYRLLKQNLERRQRYDAPSPDVGVMFLGVNEESALAAGRQIQRTAERFLDLKPSIIDVQQKMGSVRRVHLGRWVLDAPGIEALLSLIGAAADGSEDQREARSPMPLQTRADPQPVHLHLSMPEEDIEAVAAENEPSPMDEHEQAGVPVNLSELAIRSFPAGPVAGEAEATVESQATESVRLHEFVSGLTLLGARCPHHESVELAVDETGRLHLLLQAQGSADQAARRLAEVRAWAVLHAKVLSLTCAPGKLNIATSPVAHLFTDQPKACLSLASADVYRVHLLQRISLGAAVRWVHVELN